MISIKIIFNSMIVQQFEDAKFYLNLYG